MKENLKNYEWLLQRLYGKIPPRSGSPGFEIPEPEMLRIGDKIIVRNFREIAERLKRDPFLLARYMMREMATGGRYDEDTGQLTLDSTISRKTFMDTLSNFEKMYVRCPTCMSVDTRLEKRDKTWILVCEACGAEQPVPKPF